MVAAVAAPAVVVVANNSRLERHKRHVLQDYWKNLGDKMGNLTNVLEVDLSKHSKFVEEMCWRSNRHRKPLLMSVVEVP